MKYDKNNPLRGFSFRKVGSGAYEVMYESDYDFKVGRYYVNYITDMTIIDATKNAEYPKKKDVDWLRKLVKRGKIKHY